MLLYKQRKHLVAILRDQGFRIVAHYNLRRKMVVKSLNLFDHRNFIVGKLTLELVRALRCLLRSVSYARSMQYRSTCYCEVNKLQGNSRSISGTISNILILFVCNDQIRSFAYKRP